jgi:hypothetical protein
MRTIEISDDVFEYLNSKAIGFDLNTPDKVLKKILGLSSTQNTLSAKKETIVMLNYKGVDFPEGMQLRVKTRPSETAMVKGGRILYKNEPHKSPSGAAVAANGGSTNGWIYWEYLDNSGQWKLIDNLRVRKNK